MNDAHIGVEDTRARVHGQEEVALLDVRESGQYGEGHPFFAVSLPYSRLEIDAPRLLPSRRVPIVLLDDGDGVATRAREALRALGYADVRCLEDGAPGWAAAGYTLFKGVNLPSKAFGELVEHAMETPSIGPEELEAMRRDGQAHVVLDGRTAAEFRKMSIPGATSCPNAELPLRIAALRPDPGTTVVVNCAGRTRSIIGAQGLRSLGLGADVVALRNGTQGWALAGLSLAHGQDPAPLPEPAPEECEALARRGADLLARSGVPTVSEDLVARWRSEAGRSTYVLDVRTAEEYAAGRAEDALHAPGGQLVQATDQWVAVRNARIVLCDDKVVRAALTAMWLRAMGHDVSVLTAWSPAPALPAEATGPRAGIDARDAAARLQDGARVIDVSPSMAYRAEHIRGAIWGIRPMLPTLAVRRCQTLVVGRDDAVVALAVQELSAAGCEDVLAVHGGPQDWRDAGLEVVATPTDPPDDRALDYLFFVHDRHDGNLDAARAYLSWETGLIAQMHEDELALMRPLVPTLG